MGCGFSLIGGQINHLNSDQQCAENGRAKETNPPNNIGDAVMSAADRDVLIIPSTSMPRPEQRASCCKNVLQHHDEAVTSCHALIDAGDKPNDDTKNDGLGNAKDMCERTLHPHHGDGTCGTGVTGSDVVLTDAAAHIVGEGSASASHTRTCSEWSQPHAHGCGFLASSSSNPVATRCDANTMFVHNGEGERLNQEEKEEPPFTDANTGNDKFGVCLPPDAVDLEQISGSEQRAVSQKGDEGQGAAESTSLNQALRIELERITDLLAQHEKEREEAERSLTDAAKRLRGKKETVEKLSREHGELTATKSRLEMECSRNNRELAHYKSRYEMEIIPMYSTIARLREECSDLHSALCDMQRTFADLTRLTSVETVTS